MNLPKNKKMIFLVVVAVAMILIGLYMYGKKVQRESSESNTPANAGPQLTDAEKRFLQPGTSLNGANTENEALILQTRYAGMSREEILADYIKYGFETNPGYIAFLQQKANEEGKSLAEMKIGNAEYLLWSFKVPGF